MLVRSICTIVLVILVALAILGARKYLPSGNRSRLFAPAVVTSSAVGLFGVTYLWLFQVSTCAHGRLNVGCALNSNQGILTLEALLIAGGAVWASILAESRRARDAILNLARRATAALAEAINETAHNLSHVAVHTDGSSGKMRTQPRLSVSAIEHAMSPEFYDFYPANLDHWLITVHRNLQRFEMRMSQVDSSEDARNEAFLTPNSVCVHLRFLVLCVCA